MKMSERDCWTLREMLVNCPKRVGQELRYMPRSGKSRTPNLLAKQYYPNWLSLLPLTKVDKWSDILAEPIVSTASELGCLKLGEINERP